MNQGTPLDLDHSTIEDGRLSGASPGSLAAIAQLVEHFLGKEEVPGSSPGSSSTEEGDLPL